MSIQQEEITIKEFRSGTTLLFFSTHLDIIPPDQRDGIEYSPSIVQLNNIGLPYELTTFDGQNIWTMNDDNHYIPVSSITPSYITGYSYSVDFDRIIPEEKIEAYRNRLSTSIGEYLAGIDGFGNVTGSPKPHQEYVFRQYHEIDDFYVNVKLNRTTSTLDTLNVYNNLVNTWPTQEAETGVVFGRLMALQTIKDAEGNNIRIPLRNVPVGVFNPSEDYPTAASVTDNGDRIFLNLKESADPSEYFNIESFNLDKDKLLRSGSQFDSVPDQYKYITKTNDEGEFVIYDVPIGTQIVVFEVDLLKQGLTRDEIALNFFPFPPDDDAIIDQIPNFSFKQFPINVVPAWGTVQTGYTELDVVVNMDLRKWTTYFFPPVSLFAQKLEASVAANAANTAKIEVRNMTKENFPKTDIKLTLIPEDLDRVLNQQLNWNLEFAQIRSKSEFYKFGCPILKLPANLYDPFGYKTDADGVPTNQKGVWLSSYQFSLYSDPSGAPNRKSGSINAWNGSALYTKSHFDLNFSPAVPDTAPFPSEGAGLGNFPYERPWTIEYPNKYSIPQKPTDIRYQYDFDRTPTSNPSLYYLDEPAYNDGDLVGIPVIATNVQVGGYGSQSAFGEWFHNRIAEVMTKNYMYKYEAGVAWNEKYANGYEPSNGGYPRFAGVSSVVGGEKYQRFESGYGYFMRPSGWPRVMRTTWGADTYFGPDITHVNAGGQLGGNPESPGPGTTTSVVSGSLWGAENHTNDIYNLDNINLAVSLDRNSIIKNGTLEAYRVINSNPENLETAKNFVLPTKVYVKIEASASRAAYWGFRNDGDIPVEIPNTFSSINSSGPGIVWWNPTGSTVITFLTGSVAAPATLTLNPGGYVFGWNEGNFSSQASPGDTIGWTGYILPGNTNYNPSTNRYDKGKYTFYVYYLGDVEYSQPLTITRSLNTNIPGAEETWYVKTLSEGGPSGTWNAGLNSDGNTNNSGSSGKIWRMELQDNNNTYQVP